MSGYSDGGAKSFLEEHILPNSYIKVFKMTF